MRVHAAVLCLSGKVFIPFFLLVCIGQLICCAVEVSCVQIHYPSRHFTVVYSVSSAEWRTFRTYCARKCSFRMMLYNTKFPQITVV